VIRCPVCGGACGPHICAKNVEASKPTCPTCKGKCCRDLDYGYRVEHMSAESYHDCDACFDGDVPPMGDRASIVAFLRREYRAGPWQGETILLILADAIEREVDRENV
jgi:hypothetical protein